MDLKIIFEDEDLCVIDKPTGVVVNDSNSTNGETIQSWFGEKETKFKDQNLNDSEFFRKGGVVHRLDKDASGVLVLAKNEKSYEGLKKQFLERQIEKTYLVLVHGKLTEKEGILSTPIERNPNKKMRFFVGTDLAKTAVTIWKVIQEIQQFSLLEIKLLTGRTHQIRVHMKHLGHPVVSDPLYGFAKTWRDDLKFCPRLFLHAFRIEFLHPVSFSAMKFEADLAPDLQAALKKI